MTPRIGITVSKLQPVTQHASDLFGLARSYAAAVTDAGGEPVPVPVGIAEADLRALNAGLNGVLLPGGGDIQPRRYGQSHRAVLVNVNAARDDLELRLAAWLLTDRKPLLAICRGLQVLNVAAGGTLFQDLATNRPGSLDHREVAGQPKDTLAHQIEVTPGSRLAAIVGAGPLQVNSRHHQAADQVGAGLVVSAKAPDGVIEGLERPGHPFMIAVQCHPENLVTGEPRWAALFAAFVAACEASAP
jgi:putative glutamine amidotransferase